MFLKSEAAYNINVILSVEKTNSKPLGKVWFQSNQYYQLEKMRLDFVFQDMSFELDVNPLAAFKHLHTLDLNFYDNHRYFVNILPKPLTSRWETSPKRIFWTWVSFAMCINEHELFTVVTCLNEASTAWLDSNPSHCKNLEPTPNKKSLSFSGTRCLRRSWEPVGNKSKLWSTTFSLTIAP